MDPAVVALGGVVAGVVLDQGVAIVRETRRERRAATELAQARHDEQLAEIRTALHRIENTQAGHAALLEHFVPGPRPLQEVDRGHRE